MNQRKLKALFRNNETWARDMAASDPEFFTRLARLQTPRYMWIGCADSRVPANEITGLLPGEVFVHRNVANVVVHTDLNCLSVVQFAVDVLKVEHIIVCGHYGCGGVIAALRGTRMGLIDNWLQHIQDVRDKHAAALARLADERERIDRLCELNAIEQAVNLCHTTIVGDAWERGQSLTIHAWAYALHDGRVRDLDFSVSSAAGMAPAYETAITAEYPTIPRAPAQG